MDEIVVHPSLATSDKQNINLSDKMEEPDDKKDSMLDSGEEDDLSSSVSKSTAAQDHEAFEAFQNKVLALGSELRAQFLDVENLEHGWVARTVDLILQDPPSEAGLPDTTKAILRIPHLIQSKSSGDEVHEHAIAPETSSRPQGDEAEATNETESPYAWFNKKESNRPENARLNLLDEAAVLNLLASSKIQVPKVIALDITKDNPIKSPYSLYTRLPGIKLGEVWKTMSMDDKMNIVEELAGILASLNAVRFPEAGTLLHDDTISVMQMPLNLVKRNEIGIQVVIGGFHRGAGLDLFHARDRPGVPKTSALYDLLSVHIDDQIQYHESISPNGPDPGIAKLKDILQDMKDMNWFEPDDDSADYSVVNRWYTVPEHLMVEKTNNADGASGWHITGIIHWEHAHCVPPVLARQPPMWLWDFFDVELLPRSIRKYVGMDYDMMPLEFYKEINTDHLTAEGAQLKERFEQVMVDKIYASRYGARAMEVYKDDAYGRGRWLRRVWRFAKEGITDMMDVYSFKQVLKEWAEFKQTGQVSYSTVFDSEDDSLTNSSRSTIAYDHEPFETFHYKVSTLGSDLGVVFEDVKRMSGGSFNRVVPATLRNPPETASWADGTKVIIRIPRVWDGDLAKVPAHKHGRTCRCDAHPERKVDDSEEEENKSQDTKSDTGETATDLTPNEITTSSVESKSCANDASADNDPSPEEDGTSDTSETSDFSDVSDISSRMSLSKEPYRWEILDETVLYNLLEDSGIPAPRILAFDISRENALRLPYSIQSRLPGVTWISVIEGMPLKSQLRLAEELADVMARLQTIQFDSSGRLLCDEQAETPLSLSLGSSSQTELKEKLETWGFPKKVGPLMDSERAVPAQPVWDSLYDLLFFTVHDLLTRELQKVEPQGPSEQLVRMYFKLQDMIQDMDRIGWFSETDKAPSKSVLHHWDLEARNILVEHEQAIADPSGRWHITGVIDWDHPHALPAVLCMKPPVWLWDASDDEELPGKVQEYYDNDFDWMPLEYYQKENAQHLNADGVKVKQRFEEAIVERLYRAQYGANAHAKYLDDAYGRGRWLRRIWRFASEGITHHPTHYRRMEQLNREWTEYKRVNGIEYDCFEHAETLRVHSSMVWPNRARDGGQSEFKSILHDVAPEIDQNTEGKTVAQVETNVVEENKLDVVALDPTASEDSTEVPEQKLPRSKTFSAYLHAFKCPVS